MGRNSAHGARASLPRYTSIFITLAMLALMMIGHRAITVSQEAEGATGFAQRQLIYAGVSLFVFLVCVAVPYSKFGRLAYPLFGLSLLLLGMLAAARITHHSSTILPAIRGAHRWINLGFIRAQPSEFAKLTQILLLAWYLRVGSHYRKLRGLLPPFVLTFIPMFLILLEPDLGTCLLFLPTLYVMLFLAGAKWQHLLGIVAIATILVFLPVPRSTAEMTPLEITERKATAYSVYTIGEQETILCAAPLAMMEFHQLQRIDGWLRQNDPRVIQGKGYHLHHSKIVLGSGKALGRGDWDQAETYFRMLPDDHTDFIFSIIGGQWGFVGCCIVICLYGVILLFGLDVASSTHDPFGRLLAAGVLGLMAAQVLINVGMTMGLMPITGMTLPFISYGGSSLIINCAAMGLLVNVAQRRPRLMSRHPFEHNRDASPAPYRALES